MSGANIFDKMKLHKQDKNSFPSFHRSEALTFVTKMYNIASERDKGRYLKGCMNRKSHSNGYFSGNCTQNGVGQFGKSYLSHS